jgi:hypothetical protein
MEGKDGAIVSVIPANRKNFCTFILKNLEKLEIRGARAPDGTENNKEMESQEPRPKRTAK